MLVNRQTDAHDRSTLPFPLDHWLTKALRGPGSTVTWGPSIPSAGPKRLKLEARSAESGGGALGREGLLPGLGSGVLKPPTPSGIFFSCIIFFGPGLGGGASARGPGSLNRLNPRFVRHCHSTRGDVVILTKKNSY